MLEFIRRQSTSFMSWLILGGIALIFGLQFGLPSDSLSLGASGIAKVHGEEIRDEDYKFQYSLSSRFRLIPKDADQREALGVNEELIDGIVERLLLAHEARKMGLAATVKEAEDMVINGHVMLFGARLEWLGPEEAFNYEIFQKNWIGPMRVAEPNYLQHQSEELLAQSVRDLMMSSVLVPETEVRRQYEKTANTLNLRYARYDFSAFADLVDPTPEQLDAYVAEHTEELDKRYESQKTRFTELPKQARLRLIQAGTTPEDRAALEAARAGIADGSQRFSATARARSTHDTAARGGDYGWVDEQSEAASDLPDAVRQAVPGLETDAVSEIIEADGSLWMLQVSARREGDVPKEDALRELAEDGVRDGMAAELARRAAEEDQNLVAGGTPLEEVFVRPGAMGDTTLFGGTRIEDLPVEGEAPAEGTDVAPSEGTAAPGDPFAGQTRPKAELQETGPFLKGKRPRNLGDVPDLMDDAWAQVSDAELLDGIYEVTGAVLVAGVIERKEATDEEFAEQRKLISDQLRMLKASEIIATWTQRRCFDAKGRGDIKVSEETVKRYTTYDTQAPDDEKKGEDGKAAEPEEPKASFTVCQRVGRGGLTSRFRR